MPYADNFVILTAPYLSIMDIESESASSSSFSFISVTMSPREEKSRPHFDQSNDQTISNTTSPSQTTVLSTPPSEQYDAHLKRDKTHISKNQHHPQTQIFIQGLFYHHPWYPYTQQEKNMKVSANAEIRKCQGTYKEWAENIIMGETNSF